MQCFERSELGALFLHFVALAIVFQVSLCADNETLDQSISINMEREEVVPKAYPTNLLAKDWSKRKCFFKKPAAAFLEKVHDLEVRDDDVWVVTLPKCGTTWMQELVWLVMHDFDFETAKSIDLELRGPFMEFDFLVYEDLERALKPVEALKPPRQIKSHLPLPLLPRQLWDKKPKTIYVYRNPLDAWTSSYYHRRSLGGELNKTLEEYIRRYKEADYKTLLPFDHVIEFYALRSEPWLYYTSFERMKRDLRSVVLDVCTFLNKTINEQQMQGMLKHLSFEEMKNNPMTNHHWEFNQVRKKDPKPFENHNFVRRGKVNGYKDELKPDFVEDVENWIADTLATYNVTLKELLLLDD